MRQNPPKQEEDSAPQPGEAYEPSRSHTPSSIRRHHKSRADYSRLEEIITDGPSLPELQGKLGVSKQRIHQVLIDWGLHEKWKSSRKRLLEERQAKARINQNVGLLKEQKAEAQRLKKRMRGALADIRKTYIQFPNKRALAAAENVYKDHPQRLTPPRTCTYQPRQAYLLFYHYFHAKETGTLISYYELQDRTGIFFVQAGRLLREAGLEPFYHRDAPAVTRAEGRIIKAAVQAETSISGRDLSWLLTVPRELISRYQKGKSLEARGGPAVRHNGERLWYKNCLTLYRAIDTGMEAAEAMAAAGIRTRECYGEAIAQRSRIEEAVSKFLKQTGRSYDLSRWPPAQKTNHA